MNTFLITYSINYPSLPIQEEVFANGIRSFDAWARPTPHVWLIKTRLTREEVINYLKNYAGPRDRILIMLVTDDWISINLPNDVVNWMKAGL